MKPRTLRPYKILAVAIAAAGATIGASASAASFHPLSDADGYPLVGNLVRKGDAPPPSPAPKPKPKPQPKPQPKPAAGRAV